MRDDRSKGSPARTQTDESLRTERRKTDRALAEKQAALEDDADRIVEKAREDADAVLLAARTKADEQLEAPDAASQSPEAVSEERVAEDEALRDERAAADEALRLEREETTRLLSSLLPLERDKTDRYLLTERIRSDDAVSHRDDFLGIVSHDLRDLLGGIVMTADMLAKKAPASEDGDPTRRAVERIQRYAARMNRLVGDLVDVASIDAGRVAVTPVRGDIAAVITEAVDSFQAAAGANQLTLTMELAERPLPADFDYERMLQVLANLITNSLKFTPAGGNIHIRAEKAGGAVQVSVTDTGSGIPEGFLEAIFERFRQVAENDRRGLGLGLYLSRCLVEAHGGRIWAESVEGKGSTIVFTLPSA